MSGRDPQAVWHDSVDEGQRRMDRGTAALLATGFIGGIDVMLGITAMVVLSGALMEFMSHDTAHVLGSFVFGLGLVFIVIGRSELFTENFLVPVSAVLHGTRPWWALARLWGFTLIGNLGGLTLFSLILVQAGLVPPSALEAVASVAETFADRDVLGALLSAVVAGTTMTLLTWLAHATESESAKIAVALLIGFVLAAPSLNHAVVGFGEMAFGVLTGDSGATWGDVAQNLPWAILGNLAGGLGLVTAMRAVQVRGEPDEGDAAGRSGSPAA